MSNHLKSGEARPAFDPKNKFRLYSMLYCPFAQRARLVVSAKDLSNFDIVNIRLAHERPEWYASINPLGKVPAIEFPNGQTVYESLIVADLLDELYPENPLHPTDPVAKAKQRLYVETFGNTFIPSFYKYGRDKTDENKENKVLSNLTNCENYLINSKTQFFGGDQPGMIDYMIWPFFERLPMIHDLSSEQHPTLATWVKKMKNVPAVKKIALPADIYKSFYEGYFKGDVRYDLV